MLLFFENIYPRLREGNIPPIIVKLMIMDIFCFRHNPFRLVDSLQEIIFRTMLSKPVDNESLLCVGAAVCTIPYGSLKND